MAYGPNFMVCLVVEVAVKELTPLQINMEEEWAPYETTILYRGPSVSFHVDLRRVICYHTSHMY